jgi:FkbM family methyltransferase
MASFGIACVPPLDEIPKSGYKIAVDAEYGEFFFPDKDNVIFNSIKLTGKWDPAEIEYLRLHVRPGMTCLNIGAHVGYFSKILGTLVGKKGKVISVEANPSLIPFLQRNLWGLECQVEIYPAAASNEYGTGVLHVDSFNTGDNRLFKSGLNKYESESKQIDIQLAVRTFPADDIPMDSLDFVLIDAQGWDHIVIEGLTNKIQRFRPIILCEFVPTWISESGSSPLEVLKQFQKLGYDIYSLSHGKLSPEGLLDTTSPTHWCINVILKFRNT